MPAYGSRCILWQRQTPLYAIRPVTARLKWLTALPSADATSQDRETHLGPIIRVNRPEAHSPPEQQPLVVVWDQANGLGVAWGGKPVSYALSWPTNAASIVIANGLGTGPLDPLLPLLDRRPGCRADSQHRNAHRRQAQLPAPPDTPPSG